jgi:hypothetical protein
MMPCVVVVVVVALEVIDDTLRFGWLPEVGRVVDMAVPMAVEDEMCKQVSYFCRRTKKKNK